MKKVLGFLEIIEYVLKAVPVALLVVQAFFTCHFVYSSLPLFTTSMFLKLLAMTVICMFTCFAWMKYCFKSANPERGILGGIFMVTSPFTMVSLIMCEDLCMAAALILLAVTGIMMAMNDRPKFIPYRLLITVGALALLYVLAIQYTNPSRLNLDIERLKAQRISYPYLEEDYDNLGTVKDTMEELSHSGNGSFYAVQLQRLFDMAEESYSEEGAYAFVQSMNNAELTLHGEEIKDGVYKDAALNYLPGVAFMKKSIIGGSARMMTTMSVLWQYVEEETIGLLYLGSYMSFMLMGYTVYVILIAVIKAIVILAGKNKDIKKGLPLRIVLSVVPSIILYAISGCLVLAVTYLSLPGADIRLSVIPVMFVSLIPVCGMLTTKKTIPQKNHQQN